MKKNKGYRIMNKFQLVDVSIHNGITSDIICSRIVPCAEKGLTEAQKVRFLVDYYQAREPLDSGGLGEGFYWREDDTAVTMEIRGHSSDSLASNPVYNEKSEYIQAMRKYSPDMFAE